MSTVSLQEFPVDIPTALAVAVLEPSTSVPHPMEVSMPATVKLSVSIVEVAVTVRSPWLAIWSLPLPPSMPTASALLCSEMSASWTSSRVADASSTVMSDWARTVNVASLLIESLPFPPRMPMAVASVSTLRSASCLPASSHVSPDKEAVETANTSMEPEPEATAESLFSLLSLPFPPSIPMARERAVPLSESWVEAVTSMLPALSTESWPLPAWMPIAVASASAVKQLCFQCIPQWPPQASFSPASCTSVAATEMLPSLVTLSLPLPESMPIASVPALTTCPPASMRMVSLPQPERIAWAMVPDLTTMFIPWCQQLSSQPWAGCGLMSRSRMRNPNKD